MMGAPPSATSEGFPGSAGMGGFPMSAGLDGGSMRRQSGMMPSAPGGPRQILPGQLPGPGGQRKSSLSVGARRGGCHGVGFCFRVGMGYDGMGVWRYYDTRYSIIWLLHKPRPARRVGFTLVETTSSLTPQAYPTPHCPAIPQYPVLCAFGTVIL